MAPISEPKIRRLGIATSWNTTSFSNGTHTVTATARDAAGNVASATVTVTVSNQGVPTDTTPPIVAVSAPAGGATVSGTTTVSATASDNVGVVGVQFKLDGANLGAEDTIAPYSTPWNTTSSANGTHALTAVARDAAGNSTTSGRSMSRCRTRAHRQNDRPARGRHTGGEHRRELAKLSDTTAADGIALENANKDSTKIDPALAAPQHYVDITFDAPANTAYHLWVRMKAGNISDDSVHVQFSDSVDANGAADLHWKTANSAEVVLAEMDGGTISGWGWADQGWNGLGDPIYFAASGTHTLRIQQREDGPRSIRSCSRRTPTSRLLPGPQKNDNTKLPANPVVTSDTTKPTVAVTAPADGSTVSGTTTVSTNASDDVGVKGVQFIVDGSDFGGETLRFRIPFPGSRRQWPTARTPSRHGRAMRLGIQPHPLQ